MLKPTIKYIECKGDEISGPARISRVTFSRSGKSLYYRGQEFASMKGSGFKSNYFDTETGTEYWIAGCKKAGGDRLYRGIIEIDEDVREEYWTSIRNKPECVKQKSIRCSGKYAV